MHAFYGKALITPSVLDRLFDDHPKETAEHHSVLHLDLRQYKRAVARDLEALLNTRGIDTDGEIERYEHASQSVLNFGIIDLSSLSLLNPDDRLLLQDKIRTAVSRHEPRLTDVKVALEQPKDLDRMLRFRVDAVLKVHPDKPPVTFDATLQLSSNAYQIKEQ